MNIKWFFRDYVVNKFKGEFNKQDSRSKYTYADLRQVFYYAYKLGRATLAAEIEGKLFKAKNEAKDEK